MKAAVLREVGKPLSIETVSIGKPGPREVLIRTKAAGVCHSDLHFIEGSYSHPCPPCWATRAPGSSRRSAPEVRTVKVGDHVITCLNPYCGHCEVCLTGHMNLCISPGTRRSKTEEPRLFHEDLSGAGGTRWRSS